MKKLLALLSAMLLLFSCAAAQGVTETGLLQYEVMITKIPDGWTMTQVQAENGIYLTVTSGNDADAVYMISVAPSETYAGYTLNSAMGEEELANMVAALTADYYDAQVTMRETEHGTAVICIDENGADSDYGELITIWNGYFIGVTMSKYSTLNENDIAVGMQLVSDLWVVNDLK